MNLAHPEELAPLTVYLNMWQHPDRQGYPVLLIKTASNHLNVEALRKIVNSHGREYVDRVRTISEEKDGALMENKLLAYLSEAFSGLALAMAATGLFGVLSYYVASRTNEIGLRMALGAKRLQIQWMVVGQVARVLVIGIGAGLLCSLIVARTIRNLLFGVRGNDPIPVVLACAVLGLTCLCAAWLPARRASRVDPILALRHD
jgi:ABC-type antimicrobial peptide transport system permease subunit